MAPLADDKMLQLLFERLAVEAGRIIMDIFHAGCEIARKADASPVTEADRQAEKVLLSGLRSACPDIPCVAEEEVSEGIVPSALGDAFFLIDPLDGTREFVNGNGDFTVNIALIRNGKPEVGVVFAPHSRHFFSARPGHAERLELDASDAVVARHTIQVRKPATPVAIVASRSHRTPQTDDFISRFEGASIVSVGSSLKFCLIAAGEADIYPRLGRTMEWDTAAGDAILRAAGGMTVTLDGAPLGYGKRGQPHESDFANPFFIARGGADLPSL